MNVKLKLPKNYYNAGLYGVGQMCIITIMQLC
jgi:hypothetical protein